MDMERTWHADTDGSITLHPQMPRKGLGRVLILTDLAIAGAMVWLAARMPGAYPSHPEGNLTVLLALAIGCGLAFGLSGLYLETRWRKTRISESSVSLEKGWMFSHQSVSRRLLDFEGLRWETLPVAMIGAGMSAVTASATAALAVTDSGLVATLPTNVHFLSLVPRDGRSNIPLTWGTDEQQIRKLVAALSRRFSLKLV